MFFFFNNALLSDELLCTKNLIAASNIKNFAINASNSKSLSDCKYYVLNYKRLFAYSFNEINLCTCITEENFKIRSIMAKAEKSENLGLCKYYTSQFLSNLNSIVNKITICKKN